MEIRPHHQPNRRLIKHISHNSHISNLANLSPLSHISHITMVLISCAICGTPCRCCPLFIIRATGKIFALVYPEPSDLEGNKYLLPHDILHPNHSLRILHTQDDGSKVVQVTETTPRSSRQARTRTFDVVVRPATEDWSFERPLAWMHSHDAQGRTVYDPDGYVVEGPGSWAQDLYALCLRGYENTARAHRTMRVVRSSTRSGGLTVYLRSRDVS
ncbi:hypothetical protein ACO1O0_005773 [Amphichorda felina]